LNKDLYGLKQAPRAWHGRIDNFLMILGFTKIKVDYNLYFKVVNETKLNLLVDTSLELNDATLYRQIIGSLMYMMNTRPDICFVVKTLSEYLVEYRCVQLVSKKHVIIYHKGMLDFGLSYTRDNDFKLIGYTDSNWAGSVFDRKSTLGCFSVWGHP
jgi:hypothetical protein